MPDYSKTFSQNLVKYRKMKALSQRDLAALSKVSARIIYHYENYVSHPSLDKIVKLADALEVSIADLLGISLSKKTNKKITEVKTGEILESLDMKTIKYIQMLISLNAKDRFIVYRLIESLIHKNNIVV